MRVENMMHCLKLGLLAFSAVLVANLSGCAPGSPREANEATVHWDRMGTMVIDVQEGGFPLPRDNSPSSRTLNKLFSYTTSPYLLEGKAALKVAEALRENTVAESSQSRTMQKAGGTYLFVYAFDQDGGQLHRFMAEFQSYEGMATKSNPTPTPRASLVFEEGQGKRCCSVLTLVEEKGQPLSKVQFEQYSQQFDNTDYIFLYWKN